MRNKSREERVQEFLDASGGTSFETVWACYQEENQELAEAANKFHEIIASDFDDDVKANARAHFVKEWADVQYTLSQIACYYNIDGEEAFNRVSDNNMTKVGPDGSVQRNSIGKIMKPKGYVKPDMTGL